MRPIDADALKDKFRNVNVNGIDLELDRYAIKCIDNAPTIEPERKKLTNKEWIDLLVDQFNVSRTSAKSMLHCMMNGKREDNFKKQFSGGRNEEE